MKLIITILLIKVCIFSTVAKSVTYCKNLAAPQVHGCWIQPAQGKPAQAVWGLANGMKVGIAPMPGPRGLIRIYTPYLGHTDGEIMNFIALEPIPAGEESRGFSELEMSELDNVRGKRFWSSNDSLETNPLSEELPASGVIRKINGVETLTVFIFSEPFKNGAKVYVRIRFFENRPYEIELATYVCPHSRELKNFILTATMGNYARLRTLYLEGKTLNSTELWPNFKEMNFTPHAIFSSKDMIRDKNGRTYFISAPNEREPELAEYSPDTKSHWKYQGKIATQYWYCFDPFVSRNLEGLVNGRFVYWASKSPIPGGVAFENFEFKTNFRKGETFVFGVVPFTPQELINRIKFKTK